MADTVWLLTPELDEAAEEERVHKGYHRVFQLAENRVVVSFIATPPFHLPVSEGGIFSPLVRGRTQRGGEVWRVGFRMEGLVPFSLEEKGT